MRTLPPIDRKTGVPLLYQLNNCSWNKNNLYFKSTKTKQGSIKLMRGRKYYLAMISFMQALAFDLSLLADRMDRAKLVPLS